MIPATILGLVPYINLPPRKADQVTASTQEHDMTDTDLI